MSLSGGLKLSFHQLDDKLRLQSTLVPTSTGAVTGAVYKVENMEHYTPQYKLRISRYKQTVRITGMRGTNQ